MVADLTCESVSLKLTRFCERNCGGAAADGFPGARTLSSCRIQTPKLRRRGSGRIPRRADVIELPHPDAEIAAARQRTDSPARGRYRAAASRRRNCGGAAADGFTGARTLSSCRIQTPKL